MGGANIVGVPISILYRCQLSSYVQHYNARLLGLCAPLIQKELHFEVCSAFYDGAYFNNVSVAEKNSIYFK